MFKLSGAAAAIGASTTGVDVQVTGVTTDSRNIKRGDLFIAIKGPRFDGHDFVGQAMNAGAAAAMINDPRVAADFSGPAIVVDDVRLAFGRLASWWRGLFSIPVVAITGSNGKTTVKEMLASILRVHGGEDAVLATRGNLNNDIGMPTMLLEMRPQHRFAVIEMGMNHPGEIAYLTKLARPDIALINNAGTAHIGEVGSVEAIARAKGEIFSGLGAEGVALINGDDASAEYWRSLVTGKRVVEFGLAGKSDVSARYELSSAGSVVTLQARDEKFSVGLQVPGLHNVKNALAAATAAVVLGVPSKDISAGLHGHTGVAGRLQRITLSGGDVLFDDSYNANLESAQAALTVLGQCDGKKVFVIGDMGELGSAGAAMHAEIGHFARRAGVDHVMALGDLSVETVRAFGSGGSHFSNVEDLIAELGATLDGSTAVLVKGSRFMRMERVVNAMTADLVSNAGGRF